MLSFSDDHKRELNYTGSSWVKLLHASLKYVPFGERPFTNSVSQYTKSTIGLLANAFQFIKHYFCPHIIPQTGWWRTDTGHSRKRHNIEKNGVVGHLDLPGGRSRKEEKKIIPKVALLFTITARSLWIRLRWYYNYVNKFHLMQFIRGKSKIDNYLVRFECWMYKQALILALVGLNPLFFSERL